MERARELDPLSLPINAKPGRTYRDARRYKEADVQCRKALELDPDFALDHWCLGVTSVAEKRYTEAVAEMQRANTLGAAPLYTGGLGYAYAVSGDRIRAKDIESLKKRPEMLPCRPITLLPSTGRWMRKIWLSHGFGEPMPNETHRSRTYSSIHLWIHSVPMRASTPSYARWASPQ
jgi:hypothetical protein